MIVSWILQPYFGRVLLLCARALQGVGISMFPIAFSIVRDQFPREKMAIGQGIIISMFAAGAVIASKSISFSSAPSNDTYPQYCACAGMVGIVSTTKKGPFLYLHARFLSHNKRLIGFWALDRISDVPGK